LYLRRSDADLTLTIEHRAASSLAPIGLELSENDTALALQVRTGGAVVAAPAAMQPLEERIKEALHEADGRLAIAELRERCRVRNATLHERLRASARCCAPATFCVTLRAFAWRASAPDPPKRARQRAADGSAASTLVRDVLIEVRESTQRAADPSRALLLAEPSACSRSPLPYSVREREPERLYDLRLSHDLQYVDPHLASRPLHSCLPRTDRDVAPVLLDVTARE